MSERAAGRKQIFLATDLDGTLLRSVRCRRPQDIIVDMSAGRACAFLPAKLAAGLPALRAQVRIAAVTSRSVEQYLRITWPPGCEPEIAVTTNGANLLRGRSLDADWREASRAFTAPWLPLLEEVTAQLRRERGVHTCRVCDEAFAVAVCVNPQDAARVLHNTEAGPLTAFVSGRKVYFLPPELNKGTALRRLEALPEMQETDLTVAAGDAALDLPMLAGADAAVTVPALAADLAGGPRVFTAPSPADLPELVLEAVYRLSESGLPG
ncbi:MAG: haloacid dehalogenase [Clostridia bacterium]|nr:haloacid dehalogenase [Clostridia bacterium]